MAIDFSGKPGEYTYSENEYGKSAEGIVAMGAQSSHNAYAQRTAGGQEIQPDRKTLFISACRTPVMKNQF